jgi:ribonuclease-3
MRNHTATDSHQAIAAMQHPEPSIESLSSALDALQQVLGHRFNNLRLLLRALTHPSYVNEHPEDEAGDNQRLEFLGDAVLDFVAGAWVFRHYPEFAEGRMTRLRAALVRTGTLAQLARQVGIGEALRLGRGEEEAGGRERDANLCDAFEAVTGALYLDGGLAAAEAFFEPLIGPVAEVTLAGEADWDAKSRFQEWSQAERGVTPRYRIVAETGPDHAKTFVAEVLLRREVAGQGSGRSKQAAEQAAARAAWEAVVGRGSAAGSGGDEEPPGEEVAGLGTRG